MKKLLLSILSIGAFGTAIFAQQPAFIGTTTYGGTGDGVIFYAFRDSTTTYTQANFPGGSVGGNPETGVVIANNGKFYGVLSSGCANGFGGIYEITMGGTYTLKYSFNNASDGGTPKAAMLFAANGTFYGTTTTGGSYSYGTIFSYSPGATSVTTLHSFNGNAGSNAMNALIQASDGDLYGTTYGGGANSNGVLFKYETGVPLYTVLYNFLSASDGINPTELFEASDGNLYGLTQTNGPNGSGTLFKYDPIAPAFSIQHSFTTAESSAPFGGLCEGATGYLYGVSSAGGSSAFGNIFEFYFPTSTYTNMYNFTGGADGSAPEGTLLKSVYNNKFYGTTYSGGTSNYGTLFEFDPTGPTFTKYIDFNSSNGQGPMRMKLSEFFPLQGTVGVNQPSCFGLCDGQAAITTIGGAGGYTYNWAPSGGTTSTATNLCPGTYTCTIQDSEGSIVNVTATITNPAQLNSSTSTVNVSCNGFADGSITAIPSGGTGTYYYSWSPGGQTTQTATGLTAGTYTVTITDDNGCFLNDNNFITEPAGLLGADSGTEVTCFGYNDGTAATNPTGGTPPFTFSWSPSGQTTQTAINLPAGSYTVTITDANGCTINDYHTVGEPAQLLSSLSQTQTGCIGAMLNEAYAFVSGGTPPYTYSWSSGGTTDTEDSLDAINVTFMATDINLCLVNDNITLGDNPDTDLSGIITAPTLDVSSGNVYAFKYQASINGIDTVATTPIIPGTPNTYNFTGLPDGDYLIKVVPDAIAFPTSVPTYYNNEFQWDSALVVTHGCTANDLADIHILEVNSGPVGSGFISGYIIEGDGFDGLRLNNGNNPNIPFVPGGPLKGIDVKLGKNPAGGIQARVMSDSTGYYSFDSIPDGDYTIYVDIPNLPMDSSRNVIIDIANGDTVSVQNNYYADSLTIFVLDSTVAVGIHPASVEYDNKLNIYPNPSSGILHIDFEMEGANEAVIYITNTLGQTIFETKTNNANNIINVEQYNPGVYFLNISYQNKTATQRMVITNK